MIGAEAVQDSGLQWIGLIPAHWRVVPTRSVLRIVKEEVGQAWSSTPLLSLTKRGVVLRDIDSGEGKVPGSFESYQFVESNDLIFCLFDMDETPRTVGLVAQRGMITGAYTRFVVDSAVADPQFLEWYFISIDDGKRFRPLYTGLRKVIQKPRFLAAGLALPPLAEQLAIANYLDRETARIDTLIEEQQRLVEILLERRTAVAVHAIRQPLITGSARNKLARTARIGNGSTPRRDNATYWTGGDFLWLNSSVVNKSRVTGGDQSVTAVALRECHLPVVSPGSILVGLTGQGKTRGMATILDIEATVNQHVAYVTPDRSRWLPEYLLWSLSTPAVDRYLPGVAVPESRAATADHRRLCRLQMIKRWPWVTA